jgi:hypothetical protein
MTTTMMIMWMMTVIVMTTTFRNFALFPSSREDTKALVYLICDCRPQMPDPEPPSYCCYVQPAVYDYTVLSSASWRLAVGHSMLYDLTTEPIACDGSCPQITWSFLLQNALRTSHTFCPTWSKRYQIYRGQKTQATQNISIILKWEVLKISPPPISHFHELFKMIIHRVA